MTLLSITVPTFNRAVLLDFFLSVHAPLFQKYGVPLYIADNASTDDTPQVCDEWATKFDGIRVHRFNDHVEADRNFHRALVLPNSRYVWLMGDGYEIPETMLVRAITLLSTDRQYDHVTTNLISTSDAIEGREYRVAKDVARDLPFLMTCMSCNIYGERLLNQSCYEKFYNSSVLHAAIALDFMRTENFCFYFSPEICVVTLKCPNHKKVGWVNDYFEVCFNRFPRLILMLSDKLTVEEQIIALRNLFIYTPIFGWRQLLNMRAHGALHTTAVLKHRFTITALAPWRFRIVLIAFIFVPRFLARILSSFVIFTRSLNYRVRKALGVWKEVR